MLPDLFEKLQGRAPSDDERARLLRIQDALGMRENDAFGAIVVTLEQYNGIFAAYPGKISAEAEQVLSQSRVAMAAAAKVELAKAERQLVEHVANASLELGRKLAARPFVARDAMALLALLVAFGTVCMVAGYKLGTAATPFWVSPAGGTPRLLAAVLGAPAGWLMFLLLLPLAACGARTGWSVAKDEEQAGLSRAFGWMLIGLSAAGALGALVILTKFA